MKKFVCPECGDILFESDATIVETGYKENRYMAHKPCMPHMDLATEIIEIFDGLLQPTESSANAMSIAIMESIRKT